MINRYQERKYYIRRMKEYNALRLAKRIKEIQNRKTHRMVQHLGKQNKKFSELPCLSTCKVQINRWLSKMDQSGLGKDVPFNFRFSSLNQTRKQKRNTVTVNTNKNSPQKLNKSPFISATLTPKSFITKIKLNSNKGMSANVAKLFDLSQNRRKDKQN